MVTVSGILLSTRVCDTGDVGDAEVEISVANVAGTLNVETPPSSLYHTDGVHPTIIVVRVPLDLETIWSTAARIVRPEWWPAQVDCLVISIVIGSAET